jgi:AcrR family transcriptional regulator
MAAPRRIGSPDAKNRAVLIAAAEQLLLEQGYAAVSSRRVAEKAGLKPQLVHYYFRGMDELFLAVFRRRAEAGLRAQAEALRSTQPLWALWRFGTNPADVAWWTEFVALANHRKELKAEIAYYAERFREEQTNAVSGVLQGYGVGADELPAVVAMVLMTSVARVLVMEDALGMSLGHTQTFEVVERYLRRLEGDPL